MSGIEFRSIRIDTSSGDHEGRLVLVDGRLIGVLVRLRAEEQGEHRGKWYLEAGFGPLESLTPEPFEDLDAVIRWIETRCAKAERGGDLAAE